MFICSRDINKQRIEYVNIQLAIICKISGILQKILGGKKDLDLYRKT